MKPSEELLAMRELLAGPGAWIRGTYARDRNGKDVGPYNPDAVCWCVQGAMGKLRFSEEARAYVKPLIDNSWAAWNDDPSRTHLEVVEMIERAAVAALESERGEG
jgi:hypothetical protein